MISKICRLLQVPSLNSLGIKSSWQLTALKELERTVKEINIFVQVRTVAFLMLYLCIHLIIIKQFKEMCLRKLWIPTMSLDYWMHDHGPPAVPSLTTRGQWTITVGFPEIRLRDILLPYILPKSKNESPKTLRGQSKYIYILLAFNRVHLINSADFCTSSIRCSVSYSLNCE